MTIVRWRRTESLEASSRSLGSGVFDYLQDLAKVMHLRPAKGRLDALTRRHSQARRFPKPQLGSGGIPLNTWLCG